MEAGKPGRKSPAAACLLPRVQRLGLSVFGGKASDATLSSGCAASWSLHIHPAHPDNRPSSYQPLKVSFLVWVSKVCPASDRQPPTVRLAEPRARLSPALASRPLRPQGFGGGGHRDRFTFTSMCSQQRKQKKATSLIIKRHLQLIGKPRGLWVGPPLSGPRRRPPPWSQAEFVTTLGSSA